MTSRNASAETADARDAYFTRGGQRLRFRDEGRGVPLLLLHGWTLDLEMWEPQVEALSARWRLVRVDRRGFGRSGGPASTEDDACDLLALCEHLALPRVAVLGMSQGARVAVRFCALAPERAACLILDGAPGALVSASPAPDPDLSMDELRRIAREQGMGAFRDAWSRHPLGRTRSGDPRVQALVASMLARYRGEDLIAAPVRSGPDAAPSLGAIECPALILCGALDCESRRGAAREIAALLPRATLREVPRAGHLANLDQPSLYNALLGAFLEENANRF
jgi:pimeloyl-ACP methyl ester carboxylesterase